MKKNNLIWKKIATVVATGVAALCATVFPGSMKAKADTVDYEGTFDAYIYFCGDDKEADDWGYMFNSPGNANNIGDITSVEASGVKLGDTFKISLEFPDTVKGVHSVAPLLIPQENILELNTKVKLYVDGEEVKIDKSAGVPWAYTEDRTAIRIMGGYEEIEDEYKFVEIPAGFKKLEYEITIKAATVSDVAFDNNATYHAYFGFQTPLYSFRNVWHDENYGMDYVDDTGMDYFHQVTGWDADNNAVVKPGTFHDVEINGNGTFTVAVDGLDFGEEEFASQEYFNILMLSTDFPNTGDVTISDVKFNVDGQDIPVNPVINGEDIEYITVLIQNIWNADVKEIAYYPVPPKEMSITFTVAGFDHDDPAAAAPADGGDDAKKEEGGDAEVTEAPADGGEDTAAVTEAPKAEEKKDDAKSDSSDKKDEKSNTGLIIGIVVAVLAVCGIGIGVASKKKK